MLKHLMFALACTAMLPVGVVYSTDHMVGSVDEIKAALKKVRPGDAIVLRNGDWKDADILFAAEGTPKQPITLRAETPGKVIISGAAGLRFGGSHLVVSGLYFRQAYNDDHLIAFRRDSKDLAEDCRLTECVLEDCNHPTDSGESRWISLYGKRNRIDHCSISGKTSKGTTLVAFLEGGPNKHRIDHNYFGPREKLGKNGGETIRIGDSNTSDVSSQTLVEHNCFEECNGEAEIISNKSCDNIYRHNTFLRCSGALTLRHGHGALVEGNFFLGEKARGSGGVRIIGERHRVVNNYFSNLEGDDARAALSIMNAMADPPPDGYQPVKNALVAFNTFVNCKETIVVGLAEDDELTVPPADSVIANNLIVTRRTAIDIRHEPAAFQWTGNLVQGEAGPQLDGVRTVKDLKLRPVEALYHLNKGSPAIDAATPGSDDPKKDIFGQARGERKDVGCEEFPASRQKGLLSPADVGSGWSHKSRALTGKPSAAKR